MNEVCNQCFTEPETELVFGRFVLAHYSTAWSLFEQPCHSGDLIMTFGISLGIPRPYPDPVPEDDHAADLAFAIDPSLSERSNVWIEHAERFEKRLIEGRDFRGAWGLVEEMKALGYNPDEDGFMGCWLYNQLGELRYTYEVKT